MADAKAQLEDERLRLEIEQLRTAADRAKSRPWWLNPTFMTALIPILLGIGGFVAAQISWYQQNILSGKLTAAVESAKILEDRATLATEREVFRKEQYIRETETLRENFDIEKEQLAKDIRTAEAERDRYVVQSEMLLNDLVLAARFTAQGGSVLVSYDEAIPRVTGVDLAAIDLAIAHQDVVLASFIDGILQLEHFRTFVPPKPHDSLYAQLERLDRFELDIASWELDQKVLKDLEQLRGLSGVSIHIEQLDALKEFSWLLSFSISISDPLGNAVLTEDLAVFKDGRFPKTNRLVFKDMVQELTPIWNLHELQYLEIGTAWSGIGYTVTEKDLTALRRMAELQTLVIYRTGNSAEGRENIVASLPQCRVQFRDEESSSSLVARRKQ